MEQQHISEEELISKAAEYKLKLETLQQEKSDIERQLIILEEQINPYKKQIESAFGTTDHDKLMETADMYLADIKVLESKLENPNG